MIDHMWHPASGFELRQYQRNDHVPSSLSFSSDSGFPMPTAGKGISGAIGTLFRWSLSQRQRQNPGVLTDEPAFRKRQLNARAACRAVEGTNEQR